MVDQGLAKGGDGNKLGGKRLEATLLFSDLRGFTTYSESRPAADVIEVLNGYLGEMTDAILQRDQPRTTDIFYSMVRREGRSVAMAGCCSKGTEYSRSIRSRYTGPELYAQNG